MDLYGKVGKDVNILEQKDFDFCYNSKNIKDIDGMEFDLVICAGVSGVKWKANKFPKEDYNELSKLIVSCIINEYNTNKISKMKKLNRQRIINNYSLNLSINKHVSLWNDSIY